MVDLVMDRTFPGEKASELVIEQSDPGSQLYLAAQAGSSPSSKNQDEGLVS
jgi:hypothetical protein